MERRQVLWVAMVVPAVLMILCRETLSCAALDISGAQRGMQFVRLNQTNVYHGKCLDGSEPGYYIRKGNKRGAQNWVVHLMGGSWCTSRSQCMVRAQTSLGSTRPWPEPGSKSFFAKMNEFGAGFAGILSRKGRENPTFNDWNAVLVVYCDGGLYAGSRGAYTANLTRPFFIEGHASLASVIHDLRLRGLGSARNVLFSGCSAGAQAVAMTCDAMARALPSASVKCLMDAGFFLDTPDIQGRLTWRQSVERLFKFHRMGLGIPPACRQAPLLIPYLSHFPFPTHSPCKGAVEVPTPAVQPALPPHASHGGQQPTGRDRRQNDLRAAPNQRLRAHPKVHGQQPALPRTLPHRTPPLPEPAGADGAGDTAGEAAAGRVVRVVSDELYIALLRGVWGVGGQGGRAG